MGTNPVLAISEERWTEAQAGELAFWQSGDRTLLARQLDQVYMRALQITAETVTGLNVLDIGGGPMPLAVLLNLPVASLTVVDPLPMSAALPPRSFPVVRHVAPAETYRGGMADEVWGYNVLQHVQDPAAVLETAKLHADIRVRWFDWTGTPIESHHPHSIDPNWLRKQFSDGWSVTVDERAAIPVGLHAPQSYIALVAQRQ